MSTQPTLFLVANARMPSQRAQSLQVAQVAGAFARVGCATTLVHARRRDTPPVGAEALWAYYQAGGGPGPEPAVREVGCVDWIDRFPRSLQYLPARLQELSFARGAARSVASESADAWVLSREIEVARALARSGRAGVFLEVHRVPGGRTRRRWLGECAPRLAGVVAISGGVREDLLALGLSPEAVRVEHDGFSPERFADLPSREAARRALGLDPARPVVVYTGGLLAWKGVDVLVEAARGLPQAQVVIAGGMDADVARLRAAARGVEGLRVDGFQAPERVPLYLAAADVGVVPNRSRPAISARYTSPLKVFEAMAAGLPLVASDLPSLREVLTHGEDAWLVEPDDPRALTEGLARLLGDETLRGNLAARLGERALEHTWDARAGRLVDWMAGRGGGVGRGSASRRR
ncbi:MAG: glycosyltransferase family 4 protein [Planctomycetota bacterium]|nr:glycosyltransferase family 4 protein [Planctomycetota bacterium]MDP6761439.1 glycosyltransferase family 4 protein [Planctomycetota bacterium]MDP6990478.1 glycosyltransferase family 4 protein [Planctomycetota bacterium]